MWANTNTPRTRTQQQLRCWATQNLPQICNHPGCNQTTNLELDHIINIKQGGTNHPTNLQWLCTQHHKAKTQKEAQHWRTKIKRQPRRSIGLVE